MLASDLYWLVMDLTNRSLGKLAHNEQEEFMKIFRHALSALLLLCLASPALAAEFPSRTITVINAWLPGGIVEMSYRPVNEELIKILDNHIILSPNSGAGGLMGVSKALQGKPDGYNLLLTSDASLLTLSTLRKVRWSLDDFIPIGSYGSTSYGLAVKKGDPRFNTLEEFVAYAKAHSGELTVGISGMMGTEHVGAAMMMSALGIKMKIIPYDGALQAVGAVGTGHIDCTVTPILYNETISPLAGFGDERYPAYPELKTFREYGYDVEWGSNYGLFARKGTPAAQIAVLQQAMAKAVQKPAVLNNLPRVKMNPQFYLGQKWADLMVTRVKKVKDMIAQGVLVPEAK